MNIPSAPVSLSRRRSNPDGDNPVLARNSADEQQQALDLAGCGITIARARQLKSPMFCHCAPLNWALNRGILRTAKRYRLIIENSLRILLLNVAINVTSK